MDTVGYRVKQLRERRGITQSELSRRIKVTPQAIQSLESDQNPKRKTRHVVGIAAAMDFDPKFLDLTTSLNEFKNKLTDMEIKSVNPADDLIDEAIAQARKNVTLRLKLNEECVSGRDYIKLLSDELRNLIEQGSRNRGN